MRYERTSRLLEELRVARGDGSLQKQFAALAKTDLLILDDFGLKPLAQLERLDLLDIIEDRPSRMRCWIVCSIMGTVNLTSCTDRTDERG